MLVIVLIITGVSSVGILSENAPSCLCPGKSVTVFCRVLGLHFLGCRIFLSVFTHSSTRVRSILRGIVGLFLQSHFGYNAFHASQTAGTTGRCRDTTSGWKPFLCASGNPALVFHHRELLVDLVHSHELLFSASPMGSRRHVVHVDRFAILVESSQLTIPGIVPKAVLDTDNDPIEMVTWTDISPNVSSQRLTIDW